MSIFKYIICFYIICGALFNATHAMDQKDQNAPDICLVSESYPSVPRLPITIPGDQALDMLMIGSSGSPDSAEYASYIFTGRPAHYRYHLFSPSSPPCLPSTLRDYNIAPFQGSLQPLLWCEVNFPERDFPRRRLFQLYRSLEAQLRAIQNGRLQNGRLQNRVETLPIIYMFARLQGLLYPAPSMQPLTIGYFAQVADHEHSSPLLIWRANQRIVYYQHRHMVCTSGQLSAESIRRLYHALHYLRDESPEAETLLQLFLQSPAFCLTNRLTANSGMLITHASQSHDVLALTRVALAQPSHSWQQRTFQAVLHLLNQERLRSGLPELPPTHPPLETMRELAQHLFAHLRFNREHDVHVIWQHELICALNMMESRVSQGWLTRLSRCFLRSTTAVRPYSEPVSNELSSMIPLVSRLDSRRTTVIEEETDRSEALERAFVRGSGGI